MADLDLSALGFAPVADEPAPAPAPAPRSATPTSGAPAAPSGPVPFSDGPGGTLPDGSATRDPAVWQRWVDQHHRTAPAAGQGLDLTQHGFTPAGEDDAPPGGSKPSAAKDVPLSSRFSNIAAGGNEAIAGLAGLPVDLAAGGINLATRGINAVTGASIPAIVDPVGGSGTFKRAFGVVGANPDDVQPQDNADRVLRAGAAGVTSAALPGGVLAGATRAGLVSAPAAETALTALGRFTAPNAAIGGIGAVAGDQAAQFAPDEYKPVANILGSLVGGGAAAGGHVALNRLAEYARPIQTGAVAEALGIGGRTNPLLDVAGQPIRTDAGVPVQATPGQAQMAGRALESAASDPNAVRTALADYQAPAVPGSQPTTFQVTRDPLLGQVERGLARDGGEGSAAFSSRSDLQNDARVTALRSLAPEGNPAALQAEAQSQAAAVDQAGQSRVQAVRGLAGQALDRVGGNLPPGSESQVGANLRAPLVATDAAARASERELWQAIDPDGNLAVESGPLQAKAREVLNSAGVLPPKGDEATILDAAANGPAVMPFKRLTDMRNAITDTLRGARNDPERSQEVRRLSMLLDGVHDAMASAANRTELPATAPAAASAAASGVVAPNVGGEVFTPSGKRVEVRYEVEDAGNLVTSHDHTDMTPNPAFPQELQPRQRDRAASEVQVQVQNIASRLQPERLGASSTLTDGAPIVGPDGRVESGNGRMMAIRRAYDANGPQAAAYRDWLKSQGHDTTGMDQPVLIRRRTTDMTPEERVAFAAEGNTPTTLSMSATERAAGDSRRLSDDVLQHVQSGDVTDPANREFVRNFVRQVVEPGQEGAFVTADGGLSQEGASRVRSALVHKAYGDNGLSAALAESTDPTAKVLAGAMQDAAGPMAKLRAGIEAGAVDPAVDLAPSLVEATRVIQNARQKGISLADAVGQQDAFNQVSPQAEQLLRAAYGENLTGRMSQGDFAKLLGDYANRAAEQSTSANLFGANMTADELLQGSVTRYGKVANAGSRDAAFDAVPAGAVDGAGRGGERGPIPSAGRETAPSGGSSQQGRGADRFRVINPDEAPLSPNFDQAAADRYAAARDATSNRKGGFDGAPGVKSALQGGDRSGTFRQPDAALPAGIFRPGAAGADHVRVYLEKGGSPQALQDGAAYSLRRAAQRPDGTLDPAKFAAWSQKHSSALSQLPEARTAFQTAAVAQEAVETMAARHAAAVHDYQASAAGKLLGDNDPVSTVAKMLKGTSSVADMRNLARLTANNPDARAGLQRAITDFIMRDLKGDQATVTGGETRLNAAQLQAFVRKSGPALREVFDAKQVNTLQAVADDLQRSSLSVSGTKAAGGSDTVQNAGALTFGRALLGETKQAAKAGPGIAAAAGGGFYLGGPLGAALGGVVGTAPVVARAMANARAAGIASVDDLVREAMLNPELARVLLTKVTPSNKASLGDALVRVLGRASVLPPLSDKGKQMPPAGQPFGASRNPLLDLAAVGQVATPRNPLLIDR